MDAELLRTQVVQEQDNWLYIVKALPMPVLGSLRHMIHENVRLRCLCSRGCCV